MMRFFFNLNHPAQRLVSIHTIPLHIMWTERGDGDQPNNIQKENINNTNYKKQNKHKKNNWSN